MFPFLVETSYFSVPSYLFIISLTFCICLLWVFKRAKRSPEERNLALNISLLVMVSGFIGARMFHVFFEYPNHYFEDFSRVFEVQSGGFVFYGGVLLSFFASLVYLYFKREPFSYWLDIFAAPIALGYALGRLGCFAAGCCYGKACDLPWAVTFPLGVEAPAGVALHPTQLYSSILGFLVVGFLLFAEKRRLFNTPGMLFYLWLLLHSIQRILVEQFRADWRGESLAGLSPSTWISISFMIASFLLILFNKYIYVDSRRR